MADGNEALVLVSVYDWSLPVEATVAWPGHDAPVYDLDTGERVGTCGAGFTAAVADTNTKLYYVGSEYADVVER
jgi:hypothetical protein